MSINPFLMPFIFEYHDLDGFEGLVDLVNGKHLLSGHDTGFGKLIDEKILPYVFGAQKLDKNFRASTPPYIESYFNEIDHIITRDDGSKELLSLKAGRWTIQLTMAQQLNHAFNEILSRHGDVIDKIVVIANSSSRGWSRCTSNTPSSFFEFEKVGGSMKIRSNC